MQMDQTLVHALLEAFDRSDWLEMTVTIGTDRLHVSRRSRREGAPDVDEDALEPESATERAAPEAVHTEPTRATPEPLTGIVIESPGPSGRPPWSAPRTLAMPSPSTIS